MPEACPTCGTPAEVVTGNEGTSHYVPVDGGLLARWAVVEEAEARVAELEAALTKISRGPNLAPHSEPWSKAEALIALGSKGKEAD